MSTAATIGPKAKIHVRSTYQEPTNLYVICLADPGADKSQTFRLSITEVTDFMQSASSMHVETTHSWGCSSNHDSLKGQHWWHRR